MKTFFDIFKIAFLIVGTVIGAGFITGKELVRFYGGCFLLPACFFTATLFGTFAWILLRLGKRGRIIGNAKGNRLFEGVRYVVLLVTSGAMLAGIDGVQGQVFGGKTPFFSLIALFLTVKIAKKGIEGLGKCNALLVPAMLILFLGGLTARGRFPVPFTGDCTGTYTILIYLSMNAFLASPVLIDAGKRYEKRTFLPASLLAGVMIGSCIFFAMGNLSTLGDDVQNVDVPILKLWNSPIFSAMMCVVILLAIFTTLLSSYYPLYRKAAEKHTKAGGIGLAIACFLVARLGLDVIVGKLYPIIGAVGALYMLVCAFALRKRDTFDAKSRQRYPQIQECTDFQKVISPYAHNDS